ncbi:MAG: thioredoxin family protein [Agriterribacter sp.]
MGVAAVYSLNAQPVSWTVNVEKESDTLFKVTAAAALEKGWHIYAGEDTSTGVHGVALQFDGDNVLSLGNLIASAFATAINDPVFDNRIMNIYNRSLRFAQDILITGKIQQLRVTISGFAGSENEFQPFEQTLSVPLAEGTAGVSLQESLTLKDINLAAPISDCGGAAGSGSKSIVVIFLLGFAGGLIALLTPCVFPMIPLTVSFFSHQAHSRSKAIGRSFLYGGFIAGIYLTSSLPFHFIGGIQPEIFNQISTSAGLNLFFFVVFTLFALSFFGLFEIQLPAFIANRANTKSGAGNTLGIFFMALTLTIVSFSCTGPILGSLLAGSLSGTSSGPWQLTAGMGGFGLALALPFALFALFPEWLKKLPKSGGWMEVLKKTLAFVELALALKFLSNADLVQHWGILKREVFIGIWILIAGGLALYLLNIGAFLQNGRKGLSPVRTATGIIVFGFTLYLMPGISPYAAANLKLLSGFPPPLSYSIYGTNLKHEKELRADVVNDYERALAVAKSSGKPLLVDFTGWACVNCRKMEEQVWTDTRVKNIIKEKYVLLSLYVDDRKKLPGEQQFEYKDPSGNAKDIITVGDKWATFQAVNFKQVTQPLYVVISPDGKLLNQPVGYTPDVKQYQSWLECGLDAYSGSKAISSHQQTKL